MLEGRPRVPMPSAATKSLPSRYEMVAFDFDGTLADTTAAISATVLGTLSSLELEPVAREHVLPLIGLPLAEAFSSLGVSSARVPTCVLRYRELFVSHAPNIQLFPEVRACLEDLGHRGVPMVIVSSRGRTSLLDLLDRLDARHYFAAVLGEEDAPRKKPAPDLVVAASRATGIPVHRVLVVGDTTYDIEMGHAAGSHTCAVTYGNHDWARLASARPHHRLDSLAGLGALIR